MFNSHTMKLSRHKYYNEDAQIIEEKKLHLMKYIYIYIYIYM
jgi:hypothetical protein